MKQHIVNINEQAVCVYESEGMGTIVLFIHGNSLGGEIFQKQLNNHLGKKYRCISFDLPGCGNSAKATDNSIYRVKGLCGIVSGVINELKLSNYVVAGFSLGGHLAIEICDQLPGMKGLVIFGTPPLGNPPAMDKAFHASPVIPLLYTLQLTDEQVQQLASACVYKNEKAASVLARLIGRADGNFRAGLGADQAAGTLRDEAALFQELSVPRAIFHGEKDSLVSGEYCTRFNNFIWRNSVQTVKDTGHALPYENAAEFNRLLEEFIRDQNL